MKHAVLCIDDEVHNLEALERLLRKKYQVSIASSGAEGLKALAQQSYSLIISDQKMPEMTGVEFFNQAKKIQPEAVRILLTGYTDLESVISAINKGQIYRYITKPWEPEELDGLVAQAIEVFDLRKTIRDQNEQLTAANKALLSLDRMKTDFMLLVNHELKTPLTGIMSYLQLLQENALDSEQKLYADKIAANTQRLQGLIEDTLLITRLKDATETPSKQSLDVHQLVQNIWSQQQPAFKNKTMTLKMTSQGPFIQELNQKYLEIVLRKIVQNALSHGKDQSSFEVELKDSKDQWVLTARNAMDKELQKDVSELLTAFSTAENMLNHTRGTGLGLAVTQAILKMFQGSLSISAKDKMFSASLVFPKT